MRFNKTVLFYSYKTNRLEDLINIANIVKLKYGVLFIVPDESYINILDKHGIEYICLHCKDNKNSFEKSFSEKFMRSEIGSKILKLLKTTSLGQLIWQQIFYNMYIYYYQKLKYIFEQYDIKSLITVYDRSYYPIENALIKISNEFNIKIINPFIMHMNPDESYLMIKDNPKYQLCDSSSLFEKIIFNKFKAQRYKEHFYHPAFLLMALYRFGTISEMPWLNGAGLSSEVLVSNKEAKNMHINMGIKKEKIIITPEVSNVFLYQNYINKKELRDNIILKYGISKNSKIAIITFATFLEHNLVDKETQLSMIFKTIESAIRNLNNYSILVSLHPTMKLENYILLEEKYNVKILQERLMHILPIADIFITNPSSTIAWSILCGIKTLVISYYKKLNIFGSLNSIVFVDEEEEIDTKMKFIGETDIDFKHDWELLSKDEVFNDKIIQKYMFNLNKLIDNRKE